ncbi:hypothetical protein BD779DRAFT_1614570 [Infundibulicybe gibba]|nr:hypothetical protein BD779DRAFT_1614570 [Infundibulicybe gibba]
MASQFQSTTTFGRPRFTPRRLCPDCNTAQQVYRCDDCLDTRLFCQDCIVKRHSALPFHRPREWNNGRFVKTSLMDLGLRYQLGHPIGQPCSSPAIAPNSSFVVIDIDAIHQISVSFCAVRSRILHISNLAYEYYQTIHRRTDNIGVNPPPDRYRTFLRVVREWRHLKMLKRAGRGQTPLAFLGRSRRTRIIMPGMPTSGKNLPKDWQECSPKERWRHALFLGIDANFRLKRLNSQPRYAYFVHDATFNKFLNEYNKRIPDDTSTCSNHDAIKSASIRGGKGTAASGVGTIECSRHDMKRPVSLGDLQKGERYVNMDYFFLSSVQFDSPDTLVVSYDIACQWSRNLFKRMSTYPPYLHIRQSTKAITFAIPKFHLPAHRERCQITYSLNFLPRVGRTDGEAPERGWAALNPVASSTKEMGPGSRRDTLDDILGDYNWRKITSLFTSILRKAKEAVSLREEHVAAFKAFSAALPPETTTEWTHTVQQWELDARMPNPFEPTVQKTSENAVRLELAQEEALAITSRKISVVHEDITPSLLISQGLELEDLQRRLQVDMRNLGAEATDLQRAKVVEDSNRLQRRIDAWIEVQHLYIPSVAALRARADREGGGAPVEPTNIQLMLPSHVVDKAEVNQFLLQYEWRLRFAYAHDILQKLRRQVILRTHMYRHKDRHGSGQSYNTRSHGELKPLLDNDIRAPSVAELDEVGEGRRTISWIWKVGQVESGSNDVMQQALKIEWCKSRARAHRWQEECILLQEEIKRVLAFFEWEAQRWKKLAEYVNPPGSENDDAHEEGCRAYALQQIDNRDLMRSNCKRAWRDLESWFKMGEGNADEYGFVEVCAGSDQIQISKI